MKVTLPFHWARSVHTNKDMSSIRAALTLSALTFAAACYPSGSTYAQGTMPQPVEVAGPPGGYDQGQPAQPGYPQQGAPGTYDPQNGPPPGYDPTQGYVPQGDGQAQDPAYAQGQGDPNGDPGYDPNAVDPNAPASPYGDPNDPNAQMQPGGDDQGAMNPVTDTEIDATLDGYGQWDNTEGYGQVWYPDESAVGTGFTPYESCGSWVWSTWGWTFNCDYNWGWLPFHYGRWGMFGNRWGWQRGYHWGPAWVDWRHGGGVVGWRPRSPVSLDGRHTLPGHDSHWRFAGEHDLGAGHIRAHEFGDAAEGLRVTRPVGTLPVRGTNPVRPGSLMHARFAAGGRVNNTFNNHGTASGGVIPRQGSRQPMQTNRQPVQTNRQPVQTYRQPAQTYRAPAQNYRAPAQNYRAPAQNYRAPTQRNAPTHYSAPTHSYSAPSHSSGGSSHSFGGGGHSWGGGGGGHSGGGGGGGHHR